MKTEVVKLKYLKKNPNNPRHIKTEKYKKLVNSIKEFPEMLKIRPIVVNEDMIVLGGNMRLKACKDAGLKTVPIIKANNLTPEQQKEFIIKDNVGFGSWDWDILANEWDTEQLEDWGLEVFFNEDIDLDSFFEDNTTNDNGIFKIILEYNEADYTTIINKLNDIKETKESIFFNLL